MGRASRRKQQVRRLREQEDSAQVMDDAAPEIPIFTVQAGLAGAQGASNKKED